MSRPDFVESELRVWSSHPTFLERRTKRWLYVSALPIVVATLLYLVAWASGLADISSLVLGWDTWLPAALSLLAFGLSFAATAVLASRASTIQGVAAGKGRPKTVHIWTFLLATLLIAGVAFLLARGRWTRALFGADAAADLTLLGHLLGTLPMVLVLVAVEFLARPVDKWGHVASDESKSSNVRRVLSIFGIAICFVLPMIWVDRVAVAVGKYAEYLVTPSNSQVEPLRAELLRWFPVLGDMDLAGIVDALAAAATTLPMLGLGVFVLLTALKLTRLAPEKLAPVDAVEVVRAEGFFLRPPGETWWSESVRFQRPSAQRWVEIEAKDAENEEKLAEEGPAVPESEDGGDGADSIETELVADPMQWLANLMAELSATEEVEWSELSAPEPGETCDFATNSEGLEHLLLITSVDGDGGEGRPTADQVAALKSFDTAYETALSALDKEGRGALPPMDLLVSGPPGSGRTTVLLAAAVKAVIVRGQSVLLLVPTPEKAKYFVDRLRDVATRSGVGWHVAIGELHRDDVFGPGEGGSGDEADAKCLKPHMALPDILVGTPHDYEQLLFGADREQWQARRALLRLQCVFVEDLNDFRANERRHLPFLIEKHRLVLGSEQLPVQFVIVTSQLGKESGRYLFDRLFTGQFRQQALRPWRVAEPKVLSVGCVEPGRVLERIVEFCGKEQLRTVVWSPSLPAEEQAKLKARFPAGVRARVVEDLDALRPGEDSELDIALYRVSSTKQHTLALRSRVHGSETVILRVTTFKGLVERPDPNAMLPVLPSVHSEALFASHLASAARHLQPLVPVSRELWARLGLRTPGGLMQVSRTDPQFESFPGYRFVLDPPEPEALGFSAARNQQWPWVALEVELVSTNAPKTGKRLEMGPEPRPVEMFRPLTRCRQIRRDHSDAGIVVGDASGAEGNALMDWSSSRGDSLDRMDLATVDNLMHVWNDTRYFPTGAFELGARARSVEGRVYYARESGERYLPVWEVSFFVPKSPRLQSMQSGNAPEYFQWMDIQTKFGSGDDDEQGEVRCELDAQMKLVGMFDELGATGNVEPAVDISYSARIGVLVIGPRSAQEGLANVKVNAEYQRSLSGTWTTSMDEYGSRTPEAPTRARPWPLLSMLLTAVLRDRMPGLFDYCRIVAFHGPEEGIGKGRAFVFVIEPASTRGTARDAVQQLLLDFDLLHGSLQDVMRRLKNLGSDDEVSAQSLANLRTEAGVVMGLAAAQPASDDLRRLALERDSATRLMLDCHAELQRLHIERQNKHRR